MSNTKELPQCIEAEETIIAVILHFGMEKVDGLVEAGDFFMPSHQGFYKAAQELFREGAPINIISMSKALSVRAVSPMTEYSMATEENVDYYCKLVRIDSSKRKLIAACQNTISEAFEEHSDESIISDHAAKVTECYGISPSDQSTGEMLKKYIDDCEYRYKNPDKCKPMGVPTGLLVLDEILSYGGLPRGHITIVAAETSKGKSALGQAFQRNAAVAGYSVLDVTLEDTPRARVVRHVSAVGNLENRKLQREQIEKDEWFRLAETGKCIHDWEGEIRYIGREYKSASVEQLLAQVRRHIARHKTDLVIIDYLQLINSGQKFHSQQQHVDYIFDKIENFSAQHPNTAIVLVSQMARHKGRPLLRKLYHSAKLEQGAHTVLMIWAPDIHPTHGCRAVDIAKQKDGPTGLCVLGWEGKTVRFYDADEVDANQYLEAVNGIKS